MIAWGDHSDGAAGAVQAHGWRAVSGGLGIVAYLGAGVPVYLLLRS